MLSSVHPSEVNAYDQEISFFSVVFCYVSRRAVGEDNWLQEIGYSSLVGDDWRVFVDVKSVLG